jgi:hypothetical protein
VRPRVPEPLGRVQILTKGARTGNGWELHIASLRPEGNVLPHTPLLHLTWLPPQPRGGMGGTVRVSHL